MFINTLETNLVDRPSTQVRFRNRVRARTFWLTIPQACELSRAEMVTSVPAFLDKLARHRPRFVCFVGMVIWEIVRDSLARLLRQGTVKRKQRTKNKEKNQMGLQTYKLVYGNSIGMLQFIMSLICGHVIYSRVARRNVAIRCAMHVRACRAIPSLSCSALALVLHNDHLYDSLPIR